jgi:predicted nucleotidyltransferase
MKLNHDRGRPMPSAQPNPELARIREQARPILARHGVGRASAFGSVARGEAGPSSDLDLLIDPGERRLSLFALQDLQDDLERALGRRVDLVFFDCLKPRLKERILAEQEPLL